MNPEKARSYFTFSRTIVPLLAIYHLGSALGHIVYFTTGNLGLFSGPLGDLKREMLQDGVHYLRPFLGPWLGWLVVVLFGGILFVEMGRLQGRKPLRRDMLLQAGFFCGGFGTAVGILGPYGGEWATAWPVYVTSFVLSGGLLATARWPSWTRHIRTLAIAVGTGGMVLAIIALRVMDRARLG